MYDQLQVDRAFTKAKAEALAALEAVHGKIENAAWIDRTQYAAVTWGHVGDLKYLAIRLQELSKPGETA